MKNKLLVYRKGAVKKYCCPSNVILAVLDECQPSGLVVWKMQVSYHGYLQHPVHGVIELSRLDDHDLFVAPNSLHQPVLPLSTTANIKAVPELCNENSEMFVEITYDQLLDKICGIPI